MARKLKKREKDEQPHVIDCSECEGESPKAGNPTCAGCITRQKWEAEKVGLTLLVPVRRGDCTSF